MPRKKTQKALTLKAMLTIAPELDQVSRELASLAVAQLAQEGHLGVRQGEQLRRAVATAGDALAWTSVTGDTDLVLKASTDVLTLTKGGAKAMARDLAEELASKKTEMARIDESSEYAVKLAESTKTTYPAEVTFSYTVRDAFGDLITKTEVLVVNDEAEAMSASATVLRNITGRTKLKDLMIIDIQQKQAHLEATTKALPDFLRSLQALLNEVIANLQ